MHNWSSERPHLIPPEPFHPEAVSEQEALPEIQAPPPTSGRHTLEQSISLWAHRSFYGLVLAGVYGLINMLKMLIGPEQEYDMMPGEEPRDRVVRPLWSRNKRR